MLLSLSTPTIPFTIAREYQQPMQKGLLPDADGPYGMDNKLRHPGKFQPHSRQLSSLLSSTAVPQGLESGGISASVTCLVQNQPTPSNHSSHGHTLLPLLTRHTLLLLLLLSFCTVSIQ